MAQPVTERDDRERDTAAADPLPHPMGAALTASLTGPEMAVSPAGASWEKERKTFRLSRSGPALAQGEKKVMMEEKESRNLPDGTCPVRLKGLKVILKLTLSVTDGRINLFFYGLNFLQLKLQPCSLSCCCANIYALLFRTKQPLDNISTTTDAAFLSLHLPPQNKNIPQSSHTFMSANTNLPDAVVLSELLFPPLKSHGAVAHCRYVVRLFPQSLLLLLLISRGRFLWKKKKPYFFLFFLV